MIGPEYAGLNAQLQDLIKRRQLAGIGFDGSNSLEGLFRAVVAAIAPGGGTTNPLGPGAAGGRGGGGAGGSAGGSPATLPTGGGGGSA